MARKKRRTRRKRLLPPVDKSTESKTRKVTHLDGMAVPNHNRCFDLTPVPGQESVSSHRYPLMQLVRAHRDSGSAIGLAFVDDVYGMTHWADRDWDAPPSWMDPEIFVRMVVTDERVQEICQEYLNENNAGDERELRRLIDEIFEEVYLVYMFEQFSKVRRLVADWTVAHFATKAEDEKLANKSKPRRKS